MKIDEPVGRRIKTQNPRKLPKYLIFKCISEKNILYYLLFTI